MDQKYTRTVTEAINEGVRYLHQHQFPNGEFCLYMGHTDDLKDTIPYSNIFSTSLICYSLLTLSHLPKTKEILNLSATFLQFQSMRAGTWNNFTTWSPLFKVCPADVDNTACASKVLESLNREYPTNREILLNNRSKKGLFYTWYTFRPNIVWNRDYWLLILREFKHPIQSFLFWSRFECNRNDIDAAVNANVLFYLGLNEYTEPIIEYMLKIIEDNKEDDCDLWYRNPFTIYYFFSRNYKSAPKLLAPLREPIVTRILNTLNNDGSLGNNVLNTALSIISLINLDYRNITVLTKAIKYLLKHQHINGNWERWAVYYGGPKKLSCFGSEELTTGFCLEALSSYSRLST